MRIIQADSDYYEILFQGYGDAIEYKSKVEPTNKSGVAIQVYYKGNMKYFKGETVSYSKSVTENVKSGKKEKLHHIFFQQH